MRRSSIVHARHDGPRRARRKPVTASTRRDAGPLQAHLLAPDRGAGASRVSGGSRPRLTTNPHNTTPRVSFAGIVGLMGELVERVDEHDRILGVVDRGRAIQERWLHRVATVVCRDSGSRILVHQRPQTDSLFPGHYNWFSRVASALAGVHLPGWRLRRPGTDPRKRCWPRGCVGWVGGAAKVYVGR